MHGPCVLLFYHDTNNSSIPLTNENAEVFFYRHNSPVTHTVADVGSIKNWNSSVRAVSLLEIRVWCKELLYTQTSPDRNTVRSLLGDIML